MATVNHKVRAMSRSDNDVHPYVLVNGMTDISDGEINLEAILSLGALLELDELSVDEFS